MNLINNGIQNVVLDLTLRGRDLILNYAKSTEQCSWSIFDRGGAEIRKGNLNSNGLHCISVNDLSPDLYQLCVIDGDKLYHTRFNIA